MVADRLELAAQQLFVIQDLLIGLASSDPDYYSRLMAPASRIWRSAKELEEFLFPRWRRRRRWNDD